MSKSKIYRSITAERNRQDKKWGGRKHDDEHTAADWDRFILAQFGPWQKDAFGRDFRTRMTRVAALAVAALEADARKKGRP